MIHIRKISQKMKLPIICEHFQLKILFKNCSKGCSKLLEPKNVAQTQKVAQKLPRGTIYPLHPLNSRRRKVVLDSPGSDLNARNSGYFS